MRKIVVIVLDLLCKAGHRFEGWFASQESFSEQQQTGLLCCPDCGSRDVSRLPSAPHVQRSGATSAPAPAQQNPLDALRELARSSEDVGAGFPDEARRIHYGDAAARPIRGMASVREALGLLEEGISVLPLPAQKEDLH
jgi:hypothetical protein